jgi:hypothetical protein
MSGNLHHFASVESGRGLTAKVVSMLIDVARRLMPLSWPAGATYRSASGSREPDKVNLGLYVEEVCRDLNEIGHRTIHVEALRDVPIATDRAIPIALIVIHAVEATGRGYRPGAVCHRHNPVPRGEIQA